MLLVGGALGATSLLAPACGPTVIGNPKGCFYDHGGYHGDCPDASSDADAQSADAASDATDAQTDTASDATDDAPADSGGG